MLLKPSIRIHCAWINKVVLNVIVLMVSRVIHVSILTNAVTNVSNHLKDFQIHVTTVLIIRLAPIFLVPFDVAVTQVTKNQVIYHALTKTNAMKIRVILVLSVTIPWDRLHVNVTLVSVVMALTYVLISMNAMKVSMNVQKHQNALTILAITAANVIMDMTVTIVKVTLPGLDYYCRYKS